MIVLFNKKPSIILFLFLFILSYINAQETINSNQPHEFNIYAMTPYILNVYEYFQNQYTKIEIKGKTPTTNYIVSVYSDSSRMNRIQLGQSFNGQTQLYLSPRQKSGNSIYIELECNEYPCSGTLSGSFSTNIILAEGEQLSYYVTEQNTEMEFSLTSSSRIVNIWARGQMKIDTTLSSSLRSIRKDKDNYYIVTEALNSQKFLVIGTPGDLINVGYIGYDEQNINGVNYHFSKTPLTVDEFTLSGYLKRQTLENVCYPIKVRGEAKPEEPVFGIGLILTKIAYTYVLDENGQKKFSYENDINNSGMATISFSEAEALNYKICIEFPPKEMAQYSTVNEIVYSYKVTKGLTSKGNNFNFYEPQLRGVFYPRVVQKNSKVAFIPQNYGQFKKMTMSLYSIFGFPKMTVVDCDTYPNCPLTDELLQKGESPRNINRFSSYTYNGDSYENYSPISKKQKLFVVECKESQKNKNAESKYFDLMCSFGSLIYRDSDEIELFEDYYYMQYAKKGQLDNYKINIQHESNIKKIFVDVITYTGEVEVIPGEVQGTDYRTYTSINKIYTSIKARNPSETIDHIIFTVSASSDAYYSILYNYGRDENIEMDSLISNQLQTGLSYLVTIDVQQVDSYQIGNKVVKFANDRIIDYIPFMANFFSLNCEIEVGSLYKDKDGNDVIQKLQQFGRYSHDIVNQDQPRYFSSNYEYRISIKETELSEYSGKLCKIYASAVELTSSHEDSTRDILIPNNTPQQIMFGNNVTHVSFGYAHVDITKELIVKFNPHHVAAYNVKIYFEGVLAKKGELTIVANEAIYLDKDYWSDICKNPNKICYMQLDITLKSTKDIDYPVLEFSIKSIASDSVTYIPKNILKIDYVQDKMSQFYYTELGQNENGFVTLNFLRGSGKVHAKIVSKDLKDGEYNPNWRGKYRLPSEGELFEMDPFTKKVEFSTFDTNCENGCYLLLNVTSDVEASPGIHLNSPYSIIVHAHQSTATYNEIPSITIPLDEYVIGTVNPSEPANRIFQFYNVWLNLDAEEVIFDLQIDTGGIFIKIGYEKPTANNYDFQFLSDGHDSIYTLSKDQILGSLKDNHQYTNIKDFVLTIGIATNHTDTVYTTPFAFAVRIGNRTLNEIYRVNSDQKALCKTKKVGDKYRCLFAIAYDYLCFHHNLFIYTSIQKKSTFFKLYAKYIKPIDFEMKKEQELESYIPNAANKDYSSTEIKSDFLYIRYGLNISHYLLVSAESDDETIVELMSTFFSYQTHITPNPSSPQLIMAVENRPIHLNFPKDSMVMVNIRGMGGSAEIYWSSNTTQKYHLKGRDDRLSITSEKPDKEHQLIVKATSNIQDGSGFVFYVSYNFRVSSLNFDSLVLDRSVNYVYSESDLPIIYYTNLNSLKMKSNDFFDIFLSFNKLENEVEKQLTYYENIPFDIKGYIVPETLIYEAKLSPDITIEGKTRISGVYDQALRSGFIRITKEDIIKSGITDSQKPYLFLKIEKSNNFKDIRKYKRISLETTAIQSSSNVSVSELSYQIGRLSNHQVEREYLLRTDTAYKYIILQFSSSLETLSVKIKENQFPLELISDKFGKQIYLITMKEEKPKTITLVITRKDPTKTQNSYFMFQYINSNLKNYRYSIKNTNIKVEQVSKGSNLADYTVELTPVDNYKNYESVNYIVRLYRINNRPNKPDISIRNGANQNVKEFYSPKEQNGKIKLEITNSPQANYIQVIAQIKDKEAVEYLSYDLSQTLRTGGSLMSSGKGIIILLVIGLLLFIIIIVLVIVIIVFNSKNKDLLDKVNKVSFAEGEKDDDLLIKSDVIN